MHCVALGRAVSRADHLMKHCGFYAQRLEQMKSGEDKEMGILIGSCTNDIVWFWVRDKT